MSSELTKQANLSLTEEQYQAIANLAATNYSIKDIATYLGINPSLLRREFENPESLVRFHYDKGILEAQFGIDNKLLENAKTGNITATQESKKATEKRAFDNHKHRILNES